MSNVTLRIAFAGAFALVSLVGGLILEVTGNNGGCPEWLVAAIAIAVGYIFGHAQANGGLGIKHK